MLVCLGCEWQLKTSDEKPEDEMTVERYDRIESLYLTTGDFSALQHMNIDYPRQTRMLIEDVLRLGHVDDADINAKLLHFYQDSTLQNLIDETQRQYANMEDVDKQLTSAFKRLRTMIPDIEVPLVYAQIGSLDQSIIVGDSMLGISLDKYLGADYPLYAKYGYSDRQRSSMQRSFIVPDCVGFYLLSFYPMPADRPLLSEEVDLHMGKIQWVVNRCMQQNIFRNASVQRVGRYMKRHKDVTAAQLLQNNDYASIR